MATPEIITNKQGFPSVIINGQQFAFEHKLPPTSCPKCYKDGNYIIGHMVPCSVSWCRGSIHAYHGAVADYTGIGPFSICTRCLPKIKQQN